MALSLLCPLHQWANFISSILLKINLFSSPLQVFAQEFIKKNGSPSWRLLCVTSAGTVMVVQSDLEVSWESQQSLGHVTAAKIFVAASRAAGVGSDDDPIEFVRPSLVNNLHSFVHFVKDSTEYAAVINLPSLYHSNMLAGIIIYLLKRNVKG